MDVKTINQLENLNIDDMKPIISPWIIKDELPMTNETISKIMLYRKTVNDILNNKDNRIIAISGPCSIHDFDAAIDYAIKLKKIANKYPKLFIIMRVYFEKPRTKVGWKGIINDPDINNTFNINKGIRLARQLLIKITEIGLPVGGEFLDTVIPQYISELVTWGAIGARTVESQVHRELVSGLSMPVGFKNNTAGNIQVAIDSVVASQNPHCFMGITNEGTPAIITTKGNPNTHIILRGGSGGPNYDEINVGHTIDMLNKSQLSNTGIIIDCSHGNSQKIYQNQIKVASDVKRQINLGQSRIKGFMLESNLVEGNQKCDLKDKLVYGMSITDACINLNTTEEIFALF
jgi:3-deoxy-7-phosphoheptulonate synthase